MPRIDVAERRRRLAVRHGLAAAQASVDPADVARRIVVLHSTDPATVFLSVRARSGGQVSPASIEESLYERRDLVRMLAMRRTVFVVPVGSVPAVQASTSERVARDQRLRLLKHLKDYGGVQDPEPFLAEVEESVLAIFASRREPLSAAELSAAEPRLKTTLRMAEGKAYGATANITSRVLLVLAAHGHIVRGRPIGSWLSQQYRWSRTEDWLPSLVPFEGTEREAKAELARQWLRGFGPAPITDLKWWTGWTVAQVKQALADVGAVEVALDSGPGVVLGDDVADTADPGSWVGFLPALDPTVMGWADRGWFLGEHGKALFDTNGNAGPTVWLDGRVVGGWAQRKNGEIAVKLLQDLGREGVERVEAEAGRVAEWLGEVRVIPRFRTPTERELSG
jgi:hypothetical protein